jgi:hypothetical protein
MERFEPNGALCALFFEHQDCDLPNASRLAQCLVVSF